MLIQDLLLLILYSVVTKSFQQQKETVLPEPCKVTPHPCHQVNPQPETEIEVLRVKGFTVFGVTAFWGFRVLG